MFVIGDKVSIIGGVYRDKHGTIAGVTRHMYYIKLRDGKKIRIMQYNVAPNVRSSSIWIQQIINELTSISKHIEMIAHLVAKLKF
jgi:hypothetical protein